MATIESEARARTRQAQGLLLGYLEGSLLSCWPGGDGLTIEDLLADYGVAVACGWAPDPRTLQIQHPELAEELAALFEQQAHPNAGLTRPGVQTTPARP